MRIMLCCTDFALTKRSHLWLPIAELPEKLVNGGDNTISSGRVLSLSDFACGSIFWLTSGQVASASEDVRVNMVYEVGELFELGIQLTYLLLLLALLGVGSFFVIRQVLVRRELDLSAKELQVLTTYLLLCIAIYLNHT